MLGLRIEPGAELLHYRLIERLRAGGMGVVWKAVDITLDRQVCRIGAIHRPFSRRYRLTLCPFPCQQHSGREGDLPHD